MYYRVPIDLADWKSGPDQDRIRKPHQTRVRGIRSLPDQEWLRQPYQNRNTGIQIRSGSVPDPESVSIPDQNRYRKPILTKPVIGNSPLSCSGTDQET